MDYVTLSWLFLALFFVTVSVYFIVISAQEIIDIIKSRKGKGKVNKK